jgi:hypothetical protein
MHMWRLHPCNLSPGGLHQLLGVDPVSDCYVCLLQKRIRDFKDRWKQMVSIIRQEVHTHFAASEACQRDMTHSCLEEMYSQYKSFLEVLNAQGGEVKEAVAEGPTLQTLAYELREMVR